MKLRLFILNVFVMLSFWALKSQEIEQHGGRNTVPPTVETIVGDNVACLKLLMKKHLKKQRKEDCYMLMFHYQKK